MTLEDINNHKMNNFCRGQENSKNLGAHTNNFIQNTSHPTNQKEDDDDAETPVDSNLIPPMPTTTRAETDNLKLAKITTARKSSSETMSSA